MLIVVVSSLRSLRVCYDDSMSVNKRVTNKEDRFFTQNLLKEPNGYVYTQKTTIIEAQYSSVLSILPC